MGAIFYTEPFLTFDLDVFTRNGAAHENPLHFNNAKPAVTDRRYRDALRARGYIEENEWALIEGIPVQFLPAYSSLVDEALKQAREVIFDGVPTRMLRNEHAYAICLQTACCME